MRSADAGLQHSTAPDRDAVALGYVVDGDGLGEAAYAAYLDVQDAAAAELQGCLGVAAVAYALVQADGRLEALLELGVEIKVVVPHGLLDHEQVELVPACDVVGVFHPVGRVRVAAQEDVRPALANLFEDLHVPAVLALQLYTLIAGGDLSLDLFH